ncbi:MAG: oxygen-independent coproporphyrinogen III oxidase [bacterium]
MAEAPETVSVETLRKFDKPGPRYTSYPTAVEFTDEVGLQEYRSKLAEADGRDEPLSFYTHLPFCEHRCLFCGCHVVITEHRDVAAKYLEYVKQEVELLAGALPDRRRIAQMQWGGGTPTYFTPGQLEDYYRHLTSRFTFDEGAEISIEVDPRVTGEDHLRALSDLGFNRLSMGVQDFTPEVQEAIGRYQTFEQTRDQMAFAREVGFEEGINLDLIYGLPQQTPESFNENLDQVLQLRPDRVAVYSFAYVPWIRGHQRKIDEESLPLPEVKLELYLTAMNRFLEAGYEPIGMDHFALPEDELSVAARERRLHRNFMGYTTQPATDMVAVGISGIGDVRSAFFQNAKKLSTYYEELDARRLPVVKGYVLDADDRLRQYVISRIMCDFRLSKKEVGERFGVDFDDYFEDSLKGLSEPIEEGLVTMDAEAITVTERGRLFVRNVCMAFDRYLAEKQKDRPIFSRTV